MDSSPMQTLELAFGAADESVAQGPDLTLIGRNLTATKRIRPSQVDGIIAVDPLPGDAMLEALLASNLPIVTVGRILNKASTQAVAEIEIDHYGMATA
jgi:DNA-binding LacI/PurR family transcriptional regulator